MRAPQHQITPRLLGVSLCCAWLRWKLQRALAAVICDLCRIHVDECVRICPRITGLPRADYGTGLYTTYRCRLCGKLTLHVPTGQIIDVCYDEETPLTRNRF